MKNMKTIVLGLLFCLFVVNFILPIYLANDGVYWWQQQSQEIRALAYLVNILAWMMALYLVRNKLKDK